MKFTYSLLGAAVLGLGLVACDPAKTAENNADAATAANAAASNAPEQIDSTPEPANTSTTASNDQAKPTENTKPTDPPKQLTPDEQKQAQIDAEAKKANNEKEGEGKITDMKATKDPNAKTPVPPRSKVDSMKRATVERAVVSKVAADFQGTWRFEIPENKKAQLLAEFKKDAKLKNMKLPESTLVIKPNGTFEINEVMIMNRKILGTYTVKDGVATFVVKTVNGGPPKQLADKRGFIAVIDKSGKLIHQSSMEYTKK